MASSGNRALTAMGVALMAAALLGVLIWWMYQDGIKPEPETDLSARLESVPTVPREADGPKRVSRPFKPGRLPDSDLRQGMGGRSDTKREAAAAALRLKVPGVQIDYDPVTGGPKNITASGRFLKTAVNKTGGDANELVRQFVDENRDLFGHSSAALAAGRARITREDITPHNGMRTVVWQQELDGIPLFESVLRASLTKRGDLITLGGGFVGDAGAASRLAEGQRQKLISQPAVGAEKAVTLAAADLGASVDETTVTPQGSVEGAERKRRYVAPALSDTTAHLTWVPMSADSLRLAWDVTTMSTQRGEMFRVLVDAQTGGVLLRRGLTNYISNATFRVYAKPDLQPYDSPTPFAPGHSAPSSAQPPQVSRNAVTLQAENVTASPNGWIDDGGTQTLGNNVDAHTDTDANNIADLPRPTSATRNFDFAMDTTQAPSTYRDAAVTNLFYVCNWVHDKLYALGFTESAGNFQTNNFGRGGNGNDAVQADAQDGSGTNNANFSTPSDGSPGRMQMYIFDGPTPDRDGDFDHEIVIHEYAHGLSNRLVGGGVGMSANQSQGMGEGWSDFYGLCLLSEPGDDPNGCYAAGAYATRNFAGLSDNYYFGIRRYPYSTDLLKNPLTFKDIDPAQASSHAGVSRSPIIGNTANEVHNEGEVWCVTLWEARANLIAKHGAVTGNQLILQLVTDGMKLAPVNPNFLQARDAIIQADFVNNAGANRSELWAAFAKRGMGTNASSPGSSTTSGLVESFELPDDLGVNPTAVFLSGGEPGGPFSPPSKTYTLSNNGTHALNWSATVNQPWVTLGATGGSLAGGGATNVSATINAAAASLPNGLHDAVITFTNTTSGVSLTRSVMLRAGQIDYFTELFDAAAPQDIDGCSFTFTPNGSASGYSVLKDAVTAFPTSPSGGASLTMSDDTSVPVTLTGGSQVKLYGTAYSSFHISSNGYITFGTGDISWEPSLAQHFSLPRVAAFFADLLPTTGQVTWKQLADRAAVTWSGVREYSVANSNSVQIELFFDGRIRITHLSVAATAGVTGLSRGTGLPPDFTESDFSGYFTLTIALGLPVSAVEGAGVLAGQGSVTRSQQDTSPLTVTLTSADAAQVAVPAEVIIPANETSATFDIAISEDGLLNGTRSIGITATAAGAANATGAVLVHDNETTAITLAMPAVMTEGDPGATGSVTLGAAPDRAVQVGLDSSDKNNLALPVSVTVPAGQTTVSFPVTAVEDNLIEASLVINTTASVHGWPAGTATVIVEDNEPRALSLALPSSVLEGDAGRTGNISVSGLLTADLEVSLASDDLTEATVPATITVPAGSSSISFPFSVANDADVDGPQVVHLTASAAGYTSGSQPVTVLDDETPAVPSGPSPAHLQNNTHPDADLAWSFTSGTGGVPSGYDVYFGTSPSPGAAELQGTTASASWPLPVLSAGTTYYWKIIARKGAVTTEGPVWQFSVPTGGPPVRYEWSTIASPQLVNKPFTASITGYDASGVVSTTFNGPVDILSIQGPAIVITEIEPNTPDAIEFTNVSSVSVDISGWEIYIYDVTAFPDPLPVFTIPSGTVCEAGAVFRIQEDGITPGAYPLFRYGDNINWTTSSASQVAVLLRKPDGTIVDFACAEAADAASISTPVSIPPAHWSGAPIPAPANISHAFSRTGAYDRSTAADWIAAAPGVGTLNPGLSLPFPAGDLPVDPPYVTLNTGTWSGSISIGAQTPAARLTAVDAAENHGESNAFAVEVIGSLSLAGSVTAVNENAGTSPAGLAITLGTAAPFDVTVTLQSSAPLLAASTSVLIPAGQTQAFAPLAVTDDLLLNGSRTATFTASTPGFLPATLLVTIHDNESAVLALSAPVQVTEGQGVLAGQGSVTVSAAVDAAVTVALSSGDATEISVPASVVIPAGQTNATFDITVPQDSIIDGTQGAVIHAQVEGWTGGTAAIDVLDDEPRILSLDVAASTAEGTGSITGTVSTNAAVAVDLVVSLGSSDTSEASVPATVTIPSGQSSAVFAVAIADDADADGAQAVAISAAAATFTSAAAGLEVRDNELHHFAFAPVAGPRVRNAPFAITISARAVDDLVITSYTTPGALSASVPLAPAVTGAFAAGEWTGDVTLGAYGSGVTLTITGPGGITGVSNAFDVTHGALHHFAWSSIAPQQFRNVPFNVTLTALDLAGNVVSDFAGTAALSAGGLGLVPVVSGSFGGGVWSGSVTVQQTGSDLKLLATNGAITGESNAFHVEALGALTVNLDSGSAVETAGTLGGAVQMPAARTVDVMVTLTSEDGTEVAQPAAPVTIPAGQTCAPFSITIIDDAELDGPQTVVITAAATGYDAGTVALTVDDNESTTITVALPASLMENAGTIVGGGTVTLGAAPAGPVTVRLSSSDTSELVLPPTVVIPAGTTSAGFDVTLPDDIYIDGPQNVTVQAQVPGWPAGSVATVVQDEENQVISIHLPFPVPESAGAITGSVGIAGLLPSPVEVLLVSSSAADLSVPVSVTIPAGETSVTFTAQVVDDAVPEPTETVMVTGTATSLTGANALTFITDNDPAAFVFSPVPVSWFRHVPQSVTITAKDFGGMTMTAFNGMVSLSAAGDGGAVGTTPGTSGAFVAGEWTGNIVMTGVGSNVRITAAFGAISGLSNPFAVVQAPLDHFEWETLPALQYANVPFAVTLRARDAYGHDVDDYVGTVNLSAPDGTPPVDSVIGAGTSTVGVLLGASSHDVRSQVIYTPAEIGAAGELSALSLYVGLPPGQSLTNWTIRLKHTTRANFSSDKSWETTDWTTVHQSDQTIASTGWVTFPFITNFSYNGTENLLVDLSFNNTSASSNGTVRYSSATSQRTMFASSNSMNGDPLTWSGTTPAATGSSTIWNVKLSKGGGGLPVTPSAVSAFVNGVWSGSITLGASSSEAHLHAADGGGHAADSVGFEVLSSMLALNAEPPFSGGTSNAISWVPKGTGIEYEVQRGSPVDFSASVSSGWLAEGVSSHAFSGLQHGVNYAYRARMRRHGVWTSDWTPVVTSIQDAEPPEISFDPGPEVFTTLNAHSLHGASADLTSGVSSVTVNGAAASTTSAFSAWNQTLTALTPGANSFTVVASDNAVPPNTASAAAIIFRIATPQGDLDGDGVSDLLENAFNLNPAVRDGSGLPALSLQTDPGSGRSYLTLQFRRRIQAAGFRYIVETSSALSPAGWTSDGTDVEQTDVTPTGDGVTELCTLRITPATDSAPRKFVRLRVEVD